MFCNHCGKEIPDGSKFCSGCGTDLTVPPTGGFTGGNSGIWQGNAGMGNGNAGAIPPGLDFEIFCKLPQNKWMFKNMRYDYVAVLVSYIIVEIIYSFTGVGLILWLPVIAAGICLIIGKATCGMGWFIVSLILSLLTLNPVAIILTLGATRRTAVLRDRYRDYCNATQTKPVY
ncbi:MAG: zinc ribbon domain-containing protein [Lachnospiraceae bacterium]|nr:zinc ribbon domain-containing protein [Lachnospiraceae bacterium]